MPVVYSKTLADLCVPLIIRMSNMLSASMYHTNIHGTPSRPHYPPAAMLSLGNGFGFWAIRAARYAPVARILSL